MIYIVALWAFLFLFIVGGAFFECDCPNCEGPQ